jgi:23S rRNA pseudouridine1911/1915/1917 synthase
LPDAPPSLVVLYEDEHLLAVSKPAGILTQRNLTANPTFEESVRHYLTPADPEAIYLGTVHRLDRPVSGVMLWAKTPKAARRLSDQFLRRQASKEYWAVVSGRPSIEQGVWEDWLCHDDTGSGRATQVCLPQAPRARHALTRFQVGQARKLPDQASWLKLRPETGRTHQLRVQSATRGWPILGDSAYGAAVNWSEGIALHAAALRVRHPISGVLMAFEAPIPEWWAEKGIVLEHRNAVTRFE